MSQPAHWSTIAPRAGHGERSTARPCRAIASSRRSERAPSSGRWCRRAVTNATVNSATPMIETITRLVTAQCGTFAVVNTYSDQQQRREEIEEPVREDSADERPARPAPAGDMPPQHRHARELPDPSRENGVREQPDRECREDLVEAGQRRLERLVDRQLPGERTQKHGDEVQPESERDPGPVDEVEGVIDDVPVGAAPPEQCRDDREQRDAEQRAKPEAPRQVLHAATVSGATPRAES